MTDVTTVHITENDDSVYSADIFVSNHNFAVDEPTDFNGGGDTGPSPFDLLTSSLAACTVMTMRWYAESKGLPLEKASADVSFDKKTNTFVKKIILDGDDLSEKDREKLLEIASKCPVQKVLTGDVTVETVLEEEA